MRLGRKAVGKSEIASLQRDLENEYKQLENSLHEERVRLAGGFGIVSSEETYFLLYLLAWVNALVLALYVPMQENLEAFDGLIAIFPFVNGIHMIAEMIVFGGPVRYLFQKDDKAVIRWVSFIAILVSCFGLACKWGTESGHWYMEERFSRGMIGMSVLLVVTRSRHFSRNLHTMKVAIKTCFKYIGVAFIVMLAFAQLCEELYQPLTDRQDIPPSYFGTPYKSFYTSFMIFIGEGWDGIMWDVGQQTNYGSNLLFMVYVFFVNMLFAQLLLGMVVGVFIDTNQFSSTRIYDAIDHIHEHLTSDERDCLIEDLCTINYLLVDVHEWIQYLTETELNGESEWERWEPTLVKPFMKSYDIIPGSARGKGRMPVYPEEDPVEEDNFDVVKKAGLPGSYTPNASVLAYGAEQSFTRSCIPVAVAAEDYDSQLPPPSADFDSDGETEHPTCAVFT